MYIVPRVDNYLGRVSNLPIICDTTARVLKFVFLKYTELISVIFKFMGVVEKMALEACRHFKTYISSLRLMQCEKQAGADRNMFF